MLHVMLNVGTLQTGSMRAVVGSGKSSMSLSLIAWKPRILEPSKPQPSSKRSSVNSPAIREKCCHIPGRSINLRSTIFTSCSFASATTSLGVITYPPNFGATCKPKLAIKTQNSKLPRSKDRDYNLLKRHKATRHKSLMIALKFRFTNLEKCP